MNRFPAQWSELATTDFLDGALDDAVVIMPVAAIEQHGPHLPLGTDAIINGGVLAAAAALLSPTKPVILLPPQSVGASVEHGAFPGTLSFGAATVLSAWTAVAACVRKAGPRKLLIFNSHGGQAGLAEVIAAELRASLDMVVAWASPGSFGVPAGAIDPAEAAHGLHGGLKETAMMLHLAPHLVRSQHASVFPSYGEAMATDYKRLRATGRAGFGWQAQDLNPNGVVGNAAAATAELGGRLVAHAAQGLAELIEDLLRFELPERAA